jgi:hypothetical protein
MNGLLQTAELRDVETLPNAICFKDVAIESALSVVRLIFALLFHMLFAILEFCTAATFTVSDFSKFYFRRCRRLIKLYLAQRAGEWHEVAILPWELTVDVAAAVPDPCNANAPPVRPLAYVVDAIMEIDKSMKESNRLQQNFYKQALMVLKSEREEREHFKEQFTKAIRELEDLDVDIRRMMDAD